MWRRLVDERYQRSRTDGPKADNDFQQAVASTGFLAATDNRIQHPGANGHSTHKGADNGEHRREFMSQARCKHPRPDNLVAEPGASGEKEKQEQGNSQSKPAHSRNQTFRGCNKAIEKDEVCSLKSVVGV